MVKKVIMEPGAVVGYQGREIIDGCTQDALKILNLIENPRKADQLALHCVLATERMIIEEETSVGKKSAQNLPNYRLERLKRSLDFFKNVMERYNTERLLKVNGFDTKHCSSESDFKKSIVGF